MHEEILQSTIAKGDRIHLLSFIIGGVLRIKVIVIENGIDSPMIGRG